MFSAPDIRTEIRRRLEQLPTEELQMHLDAYDLNTWRIEALEVMDQILRERSLQAGADPTEEQALLDGHEQPMAEDDVLTSADDPALETPVDTPQRAEDGGAVPALRTNSDRRAQPGSEVQRPRRRASPHTTHRGDMTMAYRVIPFTASIMAGEGAKAAAKQLEELVNAQAQEGWRYVRLETARTTITTPGKEGNPGCLGCFATPGIPTTYQATDYYMAVFSREN